MTRLSPPGSETIADKAPASTTLAPVVKLKHPPILATPRFVPNSFRGVEHDYREMSLRSAGRIDRILRQQKSFFDGSDQFRSKQATLIGLAFTFAPHAGYYVPMPDDAEEAFAILGAFRPVLEDERIELNTISVDFSVLKWQGISVRETVRHHVGAQPHRTCAIASGICGSHLGYSPISLSKLVGEKTSERIPLKNLPRERLVEYAVESVDVAWQLRDILGPMLKAKGQERVFYEIETPLLPVLVDMEFEGIRLDASALASFAAQLSKDMIALEKTIYRLAEKSSISTHRNWETLFDCLKISDSPK
jgi:DNA polymerase-1